MKAIGLSMAFLLPEFEQGVHGLRFFERVIRHKLMVIVLFLLAAALCVVLMLGVGQNYDMSKYLPEDSNSKKGIDILESEYSYNGSAVLMLEDKSIAEVLDIKRQLENIDGFKMSSGWTMSLTSSSRWK
jgi:predicted RND superfamily exporter protein